MDNGQRTTDNGVTRPPLRVHTERKYLKWTPNTSRSIFAWFLLQMIYLYIRLPIVTARFPIVRYNVGLFRIRSGFGQLDPDPGGLK
jgi:hypothetical protein